MKIGESPATSAHVPHCSSDEPGDIATYWLDNRGTRYRIVTVASGEGTILLAGHGEPHGTWGMFAHELYDADVSIAFTYLAEKLQLRQGDARGWSILISAATGWRVFWMEQVDELAVRHHEAVAGVMQ